MELPKIRNASGITKQIATTFTGYNHTRYGNGQIWDCGNLSSAEYPLLVTRKQRRLIRTIEKPNGIIAHNGLWYVDGYGLYKDGVLKLSVDDSRKTLVILGDYLCVFPDKKYIRFSNEETGSLEASWSGSVTVSDGTYAGEKAKANTITTTGTPFPFSVGDAIKLTGGILEGEYPIIREISEDKKTLRFYEDTFSLGEQTSVTISAATAVREVPDMDFVIEGENRLWGAKGGQIYASKLGDAKNWNVFDGLASDSFAVTLGSAGDITGAIRYMGYPCFFKETEIYKVYGSRPSNFELMSSASLGVQADSPKSLAIAGETLFYLSRPGIMSYSGGVPQLASTAFGEETYTKAVGGSDGIKYYVSAHDGKRWNLFVLDTKSGIWYREDDLQVIDFVWDGDLYALCEDGKIWAVGEVRNDVGEAEGAFPSFAEFGDFDEGSPNRKGVSKIQLRLEVMSGELAVKISYDGGNWIPVRTLKASGKGSVYLPVIPQRCDFFRIRFDGTGEWRMHSFVREVYGGSELF